MKKISETLIIDNGYRKVYDHHYLTKKGREYSVLVYGNTHCPDASIILGRTTEGKFLMIREYRYGPEMEILSIPTGGVEPGENLLEGTKRELYEETGYGGGQILYLGEYLHSYYFFGKLHYFFIDQLLREGDQHLEDSEQIQIELYTQDELEAMLLDNTIICPYTLGIYSLAKAKTNNFTTL